MAASGILLQTYTNTLNIDIKNQEALKKKVTDVLKKNKDADFLTPLSLYLETLEHTNTTIIKFLHGTQNKARLSQLKRDLEITYFLLLAQKRYEITHQKKENSQVYDKYLQQCEEYLDRIADPYYRGVKLGKSDAKLKLLYGSLGAEYAKMLMTMATRKTKTIREVIGLINERRLYWVWAESLLKTVLGLIAIENSYINIKQAKDVLQVTDIATGTLSWALYYFRFGLNVSLLFKHTIRGPWMSEEEKELTWFERFKTQWQMRKFTLINDFFWGHCNILTFFLLNSKHGILGPVGDTLTIALLVMDLALVVWEFAEKRTAYLKQMKEYNKDIKNIEAKIKELGHNLQSSTITLRDYDSEITVLENEIASLGEANNLEELKDVVEQDFLINYQNEIEIKKNKIAELKRQKAAQDNNLNDKELSKKIILQAIAEHRLRLDSIKRAKRKCEKEWTLQKINTINSLAYATGLIFAFTLLTLPFLPASSTVVIALGAVGAVLCFVFTMMYHAINTGVEISQAYVSQQDAEEEYRLKLQLFKNNPPQNEQERKILYLEIMKAQAESSYQNKMMLFKIMQLIRSLFTDAITPAITFAALTCMPLGVGIPIICATFALSILSNLLITMTFKPKEVGIMKFNEQEYQTFCSKVHSADFSVKKGIKLFDNKKDEIIREPGIPDISAQLKFDE